MALATRFASIARSTLVRRLGVPSLSSPSLSLSSAPSSPLSSLVSLRLSLSNIFTSISPANAPTSIRCFTLPAKYSGRSKRAPNGRRPGRRAAKMISKIKAKRRRLRRNLPSN